MRTRIGMLAFLGAFAMTAAVPEGPPIGAKFPNFTAPDQNGKSHTLASLLGPKGLVLVVFRSADW